MRSPARRAVGPLVIALCAAWLGALTGCDREPAAATPAPAVAPAPGVLLQFGPYRVLREDLEPLDAWLAGFDQTMGRKYRIRELLDQHLLPVAMARVDFATERAALRARAEELCATCGNALELRRRGAIAGGYQPPAPLTRSDLPLAAASWALRVEHIGAVSPPIETPQGFLVLGLEDILPGVTSVLDRAVAMVVPFLQGDLASFDAWLADRKRAMAGQVTYCHPDLEGTLPAWLDAR
ncbi:MAG: peptidyl-prolyl cis-trans isomerase [Planctomycetes bacterium]|nr:peptidyl-prolyl cis-trans isomerase [Planctomycetota bacterium]